MGALLLGPVYFALARLLGMLLMAAVGADLPALLWAAAAAAAASSLAMLGLEGTGRAKSEYYIGYFSLQLLLVLGSLWLARRSGASLPCPALLPAHPAPGWARAASRDARSGSTSRRRHSGGRMGNIWVVVVTSAEQRSPASRARRLRAVVLPPAPMIPICKVDPPLSPFVCSVFLQS